MAVSKQQPRLIEEERSKHSKEDPLAHLHRPLTKADLDKVRDIEGFPIGSDEDIIALSDPPYYTACPNPFLEDFIRAYGKPYDEAADAYHREPFAADVSEGKNDPIYNAHTYHTKVPHKAIMRYILHYTEPGDIVFDGFCGTGMTGVATQMCGGADNEFKEQIELEMGKVKWGARRAILCDLSPAATFIAYSYNLPLDVSSFERESKRVLEEVEAECGWMYETLHTDGRTKGRIHYTIWSDVFVCSECEHDIAYWEAAVDENGGQVLDEFECPSCKALVRKRDLSHALEFIFDPMLNRGIKRARRVPVLVNYSIQNTRYEKRATQSDRDLIKRIDSLPIPYWYPFDRMPEGDESRRNDEIGVTHVHHFFTHRNLFVLASIWSRLSGRQRFVFTSMMPRSSLLVMTVMSNYFKKVSGEPLGGYAGKPMVGTLYIPSITEFSINNVHAA